MPTVTVVIPTRARAQTLSRTLDPLLADPGLHELVVVVDGSDDAASSSLVAAISSWDERIRVVVVQRAGPAAARAAGAEAASGEVVLLLDDDVVATSGLVSGHGRAHDAAGELVVCGYMPTVLDDADARDVPTRLYAEEYERWCARVERQPQHVLTHLWAGNLSLRRSQCIRVGLLDEGFAGLHGHEDRDFGLRCLTAGLHGVFRRDLVAHHHHRRTLEQFAEGARSRGACLAVIHERHAATVGPLRAGVFADGLPRGARLLVRASRFRAVHGFLSPALLAAARVAGRLRRDRLETALVRLLRRAELAYGAAHVESVRRRG